MLRLQVLLQGGTFQVRPLQETRGRKSSRGKCCHKAPAFWHQADNVVVIQSHAAARLCCSAMLCMHLRNPALQPLQAAAPAAAVMTALLLATPRRRTALLLDQKKRPGLPASWCGTAKPQSCVTQQWHQTVLTVVQSARLRQLWMPSSR
jgi:hypothetical protein